MSGIFSCHLILTAFSNSLSKTGEVPLHDVCILPRSLMHTRSLAVHSLVDSQLGVMHDCSLLNLNVYHLVEHASKDT